MTGITPASVAQERARLDAVSPPTQWELDLRASEDRAAPLTPEEIDADPVKAALLPPTLEDPRVFLERLGPSYLTVVDPLRARFLFRDVRTDRDLTADLTVSLAARHLFRTTATLSLAGRDKIAKTAAELAHGNAPAWRVATFAAIEAVLSAEERLGAPIDLRTAPTTLPAGGLDVMRVFWPVGTMQTVAPGDAGKSTIMRAVSVSLASGLVVIPGIEPTGDPRPVLYVAGEDPVAYWHSRSVEAICRGIGIDRASLAQPIELFDARGRPLHRIARAIAERAADFGAIILDSQQALLAQADATGGIRDRDGLFWNGVDQMDRPTAIVGHPNRDDAKRWAQADGRIAGSEVNRDRVRMAWRGTFRDELAVAGTSFRRYTLTNVKNNHGPKAAPIAFAAAWQFGIGDDPGTLTFMPSEPLAREVDVLSPALAETLAAYRAGGTTAEALMAAVPSITSPEAARQRLKRLRDYLAESGQEDA